MKFEARYKKKDCIRKHVFDFKNLCQQLQRIFNENQVYPCVQIINDIADGAEVELICSIPDEISGKIQEKTILLFNDNKTPEETKKLEVLNKELKEYEEATNYLYPTQDKLYREFLIVRDKLMKDFKTDNPDSLEILKRILLTP